MKNLTLLLLILVVCAVAFSKSLRKQKNLSTEDAAELKRMLEDIDAGKVYRDQMFRGMSPKLLGGIFGKK